MREELEAAIGRNMLTKAQRAALATIGAKGGRAKGKCKARSAEHYKRLADMKRAKAKVPQQ